MSDNRTSSILNSAMNEYRSLSYEQLSQKIGDVDARQVIDDGGRMFNLEIEVLWDSDPNRDLRVIGSVDNGSLVGAIFPETNDFIVSAESSSS